MIELFCRTDFELKNAEGITPIHIDDEISSLSAILLDDDYYKVLLDGKVIANNLSVLRPEYLILFKAKAFLDLKKRKESGENVDSNDIKKHKKDILRISAELMLEKVANLPESIEKDIKFFIDSLEQNPFESNSLKLYGLRNADVVKLLEDTFIID